MRWRNTGGNDAKKKGGVAPGQLTLGAIDPAWVVPTGQAHFLDQAEEERRAGEYPIPSAATIEACRSCGAAIVWAQTQAGRAIPLSIATTRRRGGQAWALSHFADCPDSKEWKKR